MFGSQTVGKKGVCDLKIQQTDTEEVSQRSH